MKETKKTPVLTQIVCPNCGYGHSSKGSSSGGVKRCPRCKHDFVLNATESIPRNDERSAIWKEVVKVEVLSAWQKILWIFTHKR